MKNKWGFSCLNNNRRQQIGEKGSFTYWIMFGKGKRIWHPSEEEQIAKSPGRESDSYCADWDSIHPNKRKISQVSWKGGYQKSTYCTNEWPIAMPSHRILFHWTIQFLDKFTFFMRVYFRWKSLWKLKRIEMLAKLNGGVTDYRHTTSFILIFIMDKKTRRSI